MSLSTLRHRIPGVTKLVRAIQHTADLKTVSYIYNICEELELHFSRIKEVNSGIKSVIEKMERLRQGVLLSKSHCSYVGLLIQLQTSDTQ